jgi:D-threo-aldose 1-dehydrogenase
MKVGAPRRLGTSTVQTTALGLGCAAFGNLYTDVSDHACAETLHAALEMGVRYADVAPFYGFGIAERRLGALLADVPRTVRSEPASGVGRQDVVISTKVGRLLRPGRGPEPDAVFDYSADGIRRSLEESLTRLGLDRVDILYIHDPDDHLDQAINEAYPTLHQLRDEGIVGAIGAGMNFSAPLTRIVEETDIDAVLCAGRYTLLDQGALADLLPAAAKRNVSIVIGGVYNSGVLADPRPGARFDYEPAAAEIVARAQRIDEVCRRHDVPLKAAAVQFPFGHPAIATVLTGARTAAEITENAAMFEHPIPPALWQELVELELVPAESVQGLIQS